MSIVKKLDYLEQAVEDFDLRLAMEEATRCLLCEDAPCSKGCPAGTDPAKFIRSIRFRNYKGAAETIRENNILGGSCALVCPYGNLCEKECARCGIDKPIQIGKLQKFAINCEKNYNMTILKRGNRIGKKVVCIGSGPSSLACAAKLEELGVDVTIIEQFDRAGGVLTYGITPSRLPQEVVDHDIEQVKKLGVEFVFNTEISGVDEIKNLLKTYDAVFLGIGLWDSKIVDIPGIDSEGVMTAQEFLKKARVSNGKIDIGDDVVVIGGGDVAMDCVSTAKQLGAKNARIVYRRSIEESPAYFEEVSFVQSMGIPIITEFAPSEIISKDGKVVAMNFKSRDLESTLHLKADQVVFAIGQKAQFDISSIGDNAVFSGGDIVNGGDTVVQAVKEGKEEAYKIFDFLKGEK